jgi:hypothetical protein
MARRSLLAVLPLAAAAQLLACGGGSSSTPAQTPHTSAVVTAAAGGTVTLAGGAAVQIPAGALASDTTITIAQSAAAPAGAVGAAYDLGPSGTTFSHPVTVSLPVPAGTTDAVVWTKAAGAAHYTSLPTAVSGGVATAQASHFSVFLVGPVDLNGTWAGKIDYTVTLPNGQAGPPGSTMQSRDVTQDVGDVTVAIGTGSGLAATCTGTVTGATLNTACTVHNLDGACSSSYTQTGTVSGDTWTNSSSFTWAGTSCSAAGQTIHVQNSPLTRQAGAARNITGTYARTTSFTMTGPGKTPYQGAGSGTAVRTQATGSSLLGMTYTSGTSSYTCKGVVVGDVSYGTCNGTNGAVRYVSTGDATITSGPPFVLDGETATSIYNDANGYTSMTGTYHDVQQ